MSLSLASAMRHRGAGFRWESRPAEAVVERDEPGPVRLRRYLPLAVLTTSLVVVLPGMLVAAIMPRGGVLLMAASAASAVAVSIAIASAAAALWKRQPRSRDILFADLMLWGWLRRCWTERRLSQARNLFDSARKAGPTVHIELLTGLSRMLEARDAHTHRHGQRVARHAVRIARALRFSAVEIAKIRTAATVHDVGKLYIPREILNNPEALSDAEFTVVKRHAADGAEMLASVGDPAITAMVRHHHERIDGHGYPDGLVGSDIPIGARIIAVADTFDAITSSRAYRPAATQKRALDVISTKAGSQLDGVAVAAFLRCYSSRRSVAWFAFATVAAQRIFAGLPATSANLGASLGGVSSILPALAASGLLALSPGLRPDALVDRGTSLQPAFRSAHRRTIPAPLITDTRRHRTGQRTDPKPASSGHRSGPRTGRTSPDTPVSRRPAVSTPNASVTGTSTSPHEPVATGPRPPTASSPIPTPPTTPPPINGAPILPSPPITLPPTVPSVPTPSVTIPTTEAPTTSHVG